MQIRTTSTTTQDRRFKGFAKKYGSWQKALPDACNYLFNLNRYVKHDSCSVPNRENIYYLKNQMVEILHDHGYCQEIYEHYLDLPEQECWACDGTGDVEGDDDFETCWKCNGTGIYREARRLTFVSFRFVIEGVAYCWHQPNRLVGFVYKTTAEPRALVTVAGEKKPVELDTKAFAAAKDLLRWVIRESVAVDQEEAA